MAAEDGLKAQKLLAQGVWMQNTLFFQGVLDVTCDTPSFLYYFFKSFSLMLSAAFLPSPIARITVAPPLTMSPPA